MQTPQNTVLGTLVRPDGSAYQITPEDVFWAAKMINYEGGRGNEKEAAAILWTVVQRAWWMQGYRSKPLYQLMWDFSQPINPKWRRDGEKCRSGGPYHGRDECSESRLNNRDSHLASKWEDLSPISRETALRWATGRLPMPSFIKGIVDFAARSLRVNPANDILAYSGSNLYYAEPAGNGKDTRSLSDWDRLYVVSGEPETFLERFAYFLSGMTLLGRASFDRLRWG